MYFLLQSDFVNALLNFANTLNAYGLSDTEIGLFSAMVLLASDRAGLSEPKVIGRARELVAEALRYFWGKCIKKYTVFNYSKIYHCSQLII